MRRWVGAFAAVLASAVLVGAGSGAAQAGRCDEYNPGAPAHTGKITLTPADSMGPWTGELRTFVDTGSIGKVDVSVIAASPRNRVRAISASPEISALSPNYGEQLKGVAIVVKLADGKPPGRIVLSVRQVCAKYFRDTFLYY